MDGWQSIRFLLAPGPNDASDGIAVGGEIIDPDAVRFCPRGLDNTTPTVAMELGVVTIWSDEQSSSQRGSELSTRVSTLSCRLHWEKDILPQK